jgi:pantothenate kinase-related protein Tda10
MLLLCRHFAQVVLFEGWCLGFSPLPESELKDQRLLPINQRLATDYLELHQVTSKFAFFFVLAAVIVSYWTILISFFFFFFFILPRCYSIFNPSISLQLLLHFPLPHSSSQIHACSLIRMAIAVALFSPPCLSLFLKQAMDAWVVVEVESPQSVYAWREEAEANMRAAGKPAMTQAQVTFYFVVVVYYIHLK